MNLKERNEDIKNFFNNKVDTYDDVHNKFMETKSLITENFNGNIEEVLDL